MYNLLISGNDEAWEKGQYEIDLSRVLEYTESSIVDKLAPINRNINKLSEYPCLFGYEGKEKSYKFGYLTEIKLRDKRVYIEYYIDKIIGEIPFATISDLSMKLDIRDWEINRTHWAVKDEDLYKILEIKDESAKNNFSNALIKKLKKENLGEEESTTETASTITGFIRKINELNKNKELSSNMLEERVIFYRGHSNKNQYKLVPSIFRKDKDGNYLYSDNEDLLFNELLASNFADFEKDNCTLDKLVRMQHYSLPTRLLDITSNPLIALYFACNSNKDVEGEVIVFSIKKNLIKYFDSDTASCISNLCRLNKDEKNKINYTVNHNNEDSNISEFNNQAPIRKLLHYIKEEKAFFEPRIEPNDLKKIICIKSKMTNNRIVSQSGAFLLFGNDVIMDENGNEDIGLYRISIPKKYQILDELDRLNINERTVFPYIETSAKYISKKYSLNKEKSYIEEMDVY